MATIMTRPIRPTDVTRATILLIVGALAACDPGSARPTFLPVPEASSTEMELGVPDATRALGAALRADSIALVRLAPRDGFLESPWLDAATLQPTHRRPLGPDVVRLRGWVQPAEHGFSQMTVEVVYRANADPSVPTRELEREVPYANPARARLREILTRLGGKPVDVAPVVVASAPPAKPVPAARRPVGDSLAGTPVPPPMPSPVSADSGAITRGVRDSITSAAPAAAPTQGQRTVPPPAAAPRDTTPHAPAPVPRATPPAAVRHYSVQVAAVKNRPDADAIVAAYVADGFGARVDSMGVWLKVRVGDYATAAVARTAMAKITRKLGGTPFIVRR